MILNEDKIKRNMLLVPCKDAKALGNWFNIYLGVDLFSTTTSRFATSNPLEAAFEIYSHCINPTSDMPKNFLFASGRNTQKTLTLAAVNLAMILHDRRDVLHFAASKDQVKAAYKYFTDFCRKPYIKDLTNGEPTQSEAKFFIPKPNDSLWLSGKTGLEISLENPDAVRRVSMEIQPITPFSVQSRHLAGVSCDETHTLKGQKLSAYADIQKIPTASKDGKPYVRYNISSRKSPHSIVEKEIAEAAKTDLIVKRWTVLEGTETCPDARSGTDWEHERYVDTINGKIVMPSDYQNMDPREQELYNKTTFASKCLSCPIASICLGDLKKPKPASKHLQPVSTVISDLLSSDREWFIAQCMSMQPLKEGQVFPKYNPRVHYITADEMYQKFMGQPSPGPQSMDSLIRLFRSKGLKAYLGLDWGFTHPTTFTLGFSDKKERIWVVYSYAEVGMELDKHVIPWLLKLEQRVGKFTIFPDTARPDNNTTLSKYFTVDDSFDKDTDLSVSIIRRMLSPNGKEEPDVFLLSPHCDPLNKEMQEYHYRTGSDGKPTDEIEKSNDDSVDGFRYLVLNVMMGNTILMAADSKPTPTDTRDTLYANQVQKLTGNPFSTLKRNSDLTGTSGSFSWSFGDSDDS